MTTITKLAHVLIAKLPAQFDLEREVGDTRVRGDMLYLDVTTGYHGFFGIPVYAVSFGEWQDVTGQELEGEESGGYMMANTELFLTEAEARSAFVMRARSDEPFQPSAPENTLAQLVAETTGWLLRDDRGSVLEVPVSNDEHFWYVFTRFFQANSDYYDSRKIFDCVGRSHTSVEGDYSNTVKVMLPAWKLLELKVAMATMTKLLVTMQAGSNAKTWGGYYDEPEQFEFTGPARHIVGLITSTSTNLTQGMSDVLIPVVVNELCDHVRMLQFTTKQVLRRLQEKQAA